MNNKQESKESIKAFDKLLVKGVDNAWRKQNAERKANQEWLRKSAKIALKINRHLKANKLSQKGLAEMLDVSPQQINKILMGRENLKLETICKIESVLGIELISILKSDEEIVKKSVGVQEFSVLKSFNKEFLKDQVTSPSYKGCTIDFQVTKSSILVAESKVAYKKSNNRKDKPINA